MNNINLGGDIFNLRVVGADEAIEKLNELQEKLIEVRALTREIASMTVDISFFDGEKVEDGPSDN